jgi:uncharacterized membrane protein (TIGR02234 family)
MTPVRRSLTGLVAVAAGGGLTLLVSGQSWATAHVDRAPPLAPLSVGLSGRTLQAAVPALAVVALAGVVALLATHGRARRVVAVLVAATGVLTVVAAVLATRLTDEHARTLVAEARTGAVVGPASSITLASHPLWPVLAVVGALLVTGGAALTATGRAVAGGLDGRYDAPTATSSPAVASAAPPATEEDADTDRHAQSLALWKRIDRGEDPTDDSARTGS